MKTKAMLIVVLLLTISLCSSCYAGWQTIEVDGVGSFKVPGDWILTEEDGLIYFFDQALGEDGYSIYLLEPRRFRDDLSRTMIISEYYGEAEITNIKSSVILSNSAYYGIYQCKIGGDKGGKAYFEIPYVEFGGGDRYMTLVAWDGLVDVDMIRQIAKSYLVEDLTRGTDD